MQFLRGWNQAVGKPGADEENGVGPASRKAFEAMGQTRHGQVRTPLGGSISIAPATGSPVLATVEFPQSDIYGARPEQTQNRWFTIGAAESAIAVVSIKRGRYCRHRVRRQRLPAQKRQPQNSRESARLNHLSTSAEVLLCTFPQRVGPRPLDSRRLRSRPSLSTSCASPLRQSTKRSAELSSRHPAGPQFVTGSSPSPPQPSCEISRTAPRAALVVMAA